MNAVEARLALTRPEEDDDTFTQSDTQQTAQRALSPPQPLDPEKAALQKRQREARDTYGRGKQIRVKSVKDKKQRGKLRALEDKYTDAALKARDAEILLDGSAGLIEAEGELERTYKTVQRDIRQAVGIETAKKGFELKLEDLGPYKASYSRNGRDLLLAGRKGHIATMEWREGKLGCELQLNETVRDATWLHNNQFFAVAQKRDTYIYDGAGVEIHKLDGRVEVTHMQFLPYHFLLATIASSGVLKYFDTSMGKTVYETTTKMGAPTAFAQNPHNAIIHAGHQNGTVTLWSPNSQTPLVKILAHKGPVRSIAIDREGRYMVSAGSDQRMAVWDIRTFKPVNSYHLYQPGTSIAISDRNLTAVGWGTTTEIWSGLFDKAAADTERMKAQSPYLKWGGEGQRVEQVRWCPFEDILGIGHDRGFSSIIVPGAGEPNFDALEVNPYETVKQRQEGEVRSLLNKLQPGMISLDPNFVGNLDLASADTRRREREEDGPGGKDAKKREKNKQRGRNTALKRAMRRRKMDNVIDERRLEIEEKLKKREEREEEKVKRRRETLGPALERFARKGA